MNKKKKKILLILNNALRQINLQNRIELLKLQYNLSELEELIAQMSKGEQNKKDDNSE